MRGCTTTSQNRRVHALLIVLSDRIATWGSPWTDALADCRICGSGCSRGRKAWASAAAQACRRACGRTP